MWKLISNCGRQLTIHSKVREKNGEAVAIYEIVEVEFDQFKLRLLERNNDSLSETAEVVAVLDCRQLMQYGFEVEEKD